MKLYTHATNSHEQMLKDWLLPEAQKEFEVFIGRSKQYGTGTFTDKEWGKNTKNKSRTMYRAVFDNMGDYIVWSDCDIQFFRPIKDRLLELVGDNDIGVMKNNDKTNELCSGFFIAHCNEKTLKFFDNILNHNIFNNRRGNSLTDQLVFNELIMQGDVSHVELPEDEFWCKKFPLDLSKIRVQHANWIIGVDKKVAALKNIREKFNVYNTFS